MNISVITVFLSLLPLSWVFYVLWKSRGRYYSMFPFIYGAAFITAARLMDVPIEVPKLQLSSFFGLSREFIDSAVIVAGDLSDTIGVMLLVLGFVKTIETIETSERKIQKLESLLPICAWCKKIRSNEGNWRPLEEYLYDRGLTELTHGICPECAVKLSEERKSRRNRTVS